MVRYGYDEADYGDDNDEENDFVLDEAQALECALKYLDDWDNETDRAMTLFDISEDDLAILEVILEMASKHRKLLSGRIEASLN
jgi:hypothetical protein